MSDVRATMNDAIRTTKEEAMAMSDGRGGWIRTTQMMSEREESKDTTLGIVSVFQTNEVKYHILVKGCFRDVPITFNRRLSKLNLN